MAAIGAGAIGYLLRSAAVAEVYESGLLTPRSGS